MQLELDHPSIHVGTNSHKHVHDARQPRTNISWMPGWHGLRFQPELSVLVPAHLWREVKIGHGWEVTEEWYVSLFKNQIFRWILQRSVEQIMLDCGKDTAFYKIKHLDCDKCFHLWQVDTTGSCLPSSLGCFCSCWAFPSLLCLRCRSSLKSLLRKHKVQQFYHLTFYLYLNFLILMANWSYFNKFKQ